MKEIQKSFNCIFIAVGNGPIRKYAENYCKKNGINAIFTGFRKDIYNIMKSSDVLVFPSLSEGFGIGLLEAMASDLPIVATNVGSIPEIIKDKYNGVLVPVKNSKAISDSVVRILNNRKFRDRIVKNGRKVVKKYDWNIIAKKIEALFKSMIEER
jgi:glycosyltransferase involved in cell wall biosynthesis